MKSPKVLSVYWLDSATDDGWQNKPGRPPRALECHTVGFLAHESKKAIVLALSRACEKTSYQFCHTITIPKVAITTRKTVKRTALEK